MNFLAAVRVESTFLDFKYLLRPLGQTSLVKSTFFLRRLSEWAEEVFIKSKKVLSTRRAPGPPFGGSEEEHARLLRGLGCGAQASSRSPHAPQTAWQHTCKQACT